MSGRRRSAYGGVTLGPPLSPSSPSGLANSASILGSLGLLWSDLSKATVRSYQRFLTRLAEHLGQPDNVSALGYLVRVGPIDAHRIANEWRDWLLAKGLSPAYVAAHLAALHRAWQILRRAGVVAWVLRIRAPRPTPLRDTRGPGIDGVVQMYDAADEQVGIRRLRDVAALDLVFVLALRRAEACGCKRSDVDLEEKRLRILGKARDDHEFVSLPDSVVEHLREYLDALGAKDDGPLLVNLDRRNRGTYGPLSPSGLYRVIQRLSQKAGVERPVTPHGLRHSAITAALDATGGDIRKVRLFSRHRRVETVALYDDRRRDEGGEIASLVAATLSKTGTDDAAETAEKMGSRMGVFEPKEPETEE